jgi:class 3 adenylate cyclase
MNRLITYFLPTGRTWDDEDLRKHRLMVTILLVTVVYAMSYVPICILIDYTSALWSIPLTALLCLLLTYALRGGWSLVRVCNIYLLNLCGNITWVWLTTGGIAFSPNDPAFSALYPVIALLLIGKRWAIFWLVCSILLVLANAVPVVLGIELPMGMRPEWVPRFLVISVAGHAVLLYVFVNIFETSRDLAQHQLELSNAALALEKGKTESLLLNILPEEVANELKAKGHSDAHEFEQVSILFSDFKDFTRAAERMTPQELVEELNICFKTFDEIVTGRGLEKIKTIGDSYMAAGGMKGDGAEAANRLVEAALEMQSFMLSRKAVRDAEVVPAFEMRVGIHTGTVVAGIVGVKKFQYDIWGDTVNTASRMESSGEVGKVNISEVTFALVNGTTGLSFEPRGKIAAKGKGELSMWFVRRADDRPDRALDTAHPGPAIP